MNTNPSNGSAANTAFRDALRVAIGVYQKQSHLLVRKTRLGLLEALVTGMDEHPICQLKGRLAIAQGTFSTGNGSGAWENDSPVGMIFFQETLVG